MSEHLLTHGGSRRTPQSSPMRSDQVRNSADGYSWEANIWDRLRRFLILGSEGGSYYAGEAELTKQNIQVVRECLDLDGQATVAEIVAISDAGRAPSNEPALWALAAAISHTDKATKRAAAEALPQVARTGTHLYHFAAYLETMRGWGRTARWAVSNWYASKGAEQLVYQAVKYRQRDGWSHRDLLRLAHPRTDGVNEKSALSWIVGSASDFSTPEDSPLRMIEGFEAAQRSESPARTAELVRSYGLPREALKTEHLTSTEVWEALLYAGKHGMPLTALIRNLGNMTRIGLISPGSSAAKFAAERILSQDNLRGARVHPLALLIAQRTYASGQGFRGDKTWNPVIEITDALDEAFYLAFANVEPSGKSHLLALDVSGSMSFPAVVGGVLTPREAAAAMALVTLHAEPNVEVVAFTGKLVPFNISRRQRLNDVVKATEGLPFGRTDCAQPMLYAIENKRDVDAFIVYTDSETWCGTVHPKQALDSYREREGKPLARSIVVAMVPNRFTIADPRDPGMLDVVGMDTATAALIADFAAGRF